MTSQSFGYSACQTLSHSAIWPVSQLDMRSVSNLDRHPVSYLVSRPAASWPVSHLTTRPVIHFATQPSDQSVIRPVGQSASWPFSQPTGHLSAHVQYQLADCSLLVAVETALWAGSRVGTYNDVGGWGGVGLNPYAAHPPFIKVQHETPPSPNPL